MLAMAGFLSGWVYVTHSDPYRVGLIWIKNSQEVSAEVGIIRNVYPDISRYRISSAGAMSQAHFSVFVYGSRRLDRVDLFVQKNEKKSWHVVKAIEDGKEVVVR